MMKYAVIGAGVSGLSMAGMLLKKGHEVVVYEKDSRPGGLVKCAEVQGNLYHLVGGHVFNSRQQEVLDWFWSRFDRERVLFPPAAVPSFPWRAGAVVDYPIENHLDQFPEAVRSSIVHELLELYRNPPAEPSSLGEFFRNPFREDPERPLFHALQQQGVAAGHQRNRHGLAGRQASHADRGGNPVE